MVVSGPHFILTNHFLKEKKNWSAGLPVVDRLSEELSIHYGPIDQTVWIARKEVLAVYGVLSRLKIAYII